MSRRPYVRPISPTKWWISQVRFQQYMLREVTCIFIGAYMAMLVWGLYRLTQGQEAWEAYVAGILSPLGLLFQLICLGFALVNTTSWFNVTPKAMPLVVGGERVPGKTIVVAHYAVWGVVSVVVLAIAGL